MGKPVLLFSTPRSGSWPIYQLMLHGLSSLGPIQDLGEYFGVDNLRASRPDDVPYWEEFNLLPLVEKMEKFKKLQDHRLSQIASAPEKIFFKIFPHHILGNQKLYHWLRDEYEWVCLERRNVFEHLLSYLVSICSGLWYQPEGITPPSSSLSASREHFDCFEEIIWNYLLLKRDVDSKRIITYEEFCSFLLPEDPTRSGLIRLYEKTLGMPIQADLTNLNLPKRQNLRPKREAFRNINEIERWYSQSFLSNLHYLRSECDALHDDRTDGENQKAPVL